MVRALQCAALTAALAACAIAHPCSAREWHIDSAHSSLGFEITQNHAPVTGRFEHFGGTISFDPAHPEQASVAITVPTDSVTLAYETAAAELKKPEWLDSARFPEAHFTGQGMVRKDKTTYELPGTLTLKGISKPLTLHFTLTGADGTEAVATGEATLARTGFNVGEGSWSDTSAIEDTVTFRFTVTAQ